jgi:hypothetical protein
MNAQEEIKRVADMHGWDYVRTVNGDRYVRGQERIQITFKSNGSVIDAERYEGFYQDGCTPAFDSLAPRHGKKHFIMRKWLMAAAKHPTTV